MGIKEVCGGTNLSFVLEGVRVLQTEYKIMQNQETASLLPCMQYRRNGEDALCYITRGLKKYADVVRNAPENVSGPVTADLFLNIARLQENGFLSCRKVDINLRRIYVDEKTNRTRLLYFPADMHLFRSDSAFEKALRDCFIRILPEPDADERQSAPVADFSRDLQNRTLSAADIGERLLRRMGENEGKEKKTDSSEAGPEAILTAANTPGPLVFHVCRDIYTIGRRGQTADGIIPGDRRVGRVHCRIYRSSGRFYLQDLGSVNGTYVNRKRLIPDRRYELTDGSSICIAGTEFAVRIKKPGQTR